mgnify:FL=1|tara:strand:+ start:1109 stop:1297 length:189 start_codon:yes stop_codon:yes gene_type:complete
MSALLHTSLAVLIATSVVVGLLVVSIFLVDYVKGYIQLRTENDMLRDEVHQLERRIWEDLEK